MPSCQTDALATGSIDLRVSCAMQSCKLLANLHGFYVLYLNIYTHCLGQRDLKEKNVFHFDDSCDKTILVKINITISLSDYVLTFKQLHILHSGI